MATAGPANDQVISLVEYLRETIADIDDIVQEWQAKRTQLAVRLAALEAATDAEVARAADDYEARLADGRPYENAENAAELIKDAHARFVT